MKMKKFLAVLCVCAMVLGFAACVNDEDKKSDDKNSDETVESTSEEFEVTITIDGKVHKMEEGDIIDSNSVNDWRDCNGKSFDEIDVSGIKIGSDISEMDNFLVPGYTCLDYEYDPYHDGCTDINTMIYEGTLPDFDEEHVLDLMVINRYVEEDGHWKQIPHDDLDKYSDQLILTVNLDVLAHSYDEDMYNKVGIIYVTYCNRGSSAD